MRWLDGALRSLAMALAMAACACALPASARTVLELDAARQPVNLLDWGDAWIDDTASTTPERVASDSGIPWRPTQPDGIYALDTHKALWIRFVVPPAPDAERWYLEVPYPSVNKVTLYTPDSVGQWIPQSAGDTLAVASWPVPHRHPLLPIQVSAEVPRKYLLKVENSHSFSAPISFVSDSYLSHQEQRTSLVLGIYFGLATLAATLATLSAVSLRDAAYGWYAASVTLMGLSQGAITGIAGLHLWPHWPRWNDLSSLVLPVLAVASLQGFASAVVAMPERSRRLHRALTGVGLAGVITAVILMFVEPSLRFLLMVPYIGIGTATAFAAVAWAARRGDRYGAWVLAGSAPVLLGSIFPLARTAGLIPVSFWTMHAMQIGIAIELPVLLVILLLRSQQRREHRRRVQKLERIDPATGLINAQVFHERLQRMVARSVRFKYRSAVLLIDLANIEQIRRQYDRRSAEELPLRVAGRLLSAAREIDSVARLSDHRFGMLLEGPLTAGEVAEAGPRVVARCLMPYSNKPIDWVAQARVAQALVPMDGADADDLMNRLEDLLATVAEDDRRAVFWLGKPVVDPDRPPPREAEATS